MSFVGGGIGVLGDGQEVEDPAAAVVDADDLERHARAARGEQAAGVVQEGELADQDPGGEPRGDRGAERRGHDAVDAVRAAVREEAEPLGRLREVRLDVADRHRRADPDDGLVGQLGLDARRGPWPRSRRARPRSAAATTRSPLLQPSSQPSSRSPDRAPPRRRRQSIEGRRGRRLQDELRASAWARATRRADRSRPAATPRPSARSGFEVGMSPTRSNEARRVRSPRSPRTRSSTS